MVRTKCFVGNLSFRVKENTLVEAFSAAGKVAGANIITRGSRSLGYGFVEMESEEEAHEAVKLLSKKEIDGRPINVEVAKARPEGESATPSSDNPRRRAPRRRGPRVGADGQPVVHDGQPSSSSSSNGAPAAAGEGQSQDGVRRRNPNNRRRRGPRAPPAEGEGSSSSPSSSSSAPREPRAPRAPREPREPHEQRPRVPRPPREPRPESGPRNPSTTTLFVANLPFSVDDQGLTNLFKGLSLKSAHVVMKRNGRSKGFGFVEFNNEEDQRAGLQQVDQFDIEGRKVIVKVALTENTPPAVAAAGEAAPASPAK